MEEKEKKMRMFFFVRVFGEKEKFNRVSKNEEEKFSFLSFLRFPFLKKKWLCCSIQENFVFRT